MIQLTGMICKISSILKLILWPMVGHLNLLELNFFSAYPYLKPHIWFYSNRLAIWHGLQDIRHMKGNFGSWLAI